MRTPRSFWLWFCHWCAAELIRNSLSARKYGLFRPCWDFFALEIGSILHFSWLTIKSPSNKLCKSVARLSIAWRLLVAFSLFVLNEPVNWTSPYTFRSFLFHFIRDLIGNKISIFQFIYSLRRLVHYYRSISDLWHSPQIYCIFLVQCGLHFPGSTATELLNKKLVTLCVRSFEKGLIYDPYKAMLSL